MSEHTEPVLWDATILWFVSASQVICTLLHLMLLIIE